MKVPSKKARNPANISATASMPSTRPARRPGRRVVGPDDLRVVGGEDGVEVAGLAGGVQRPGLADPLLQELGVDVGVGVGHVPERLLPAVAWNIPRLGDLAPVRPCSPMAMQVHLVDGTYELFRHYYARARRAPRPTGDEVRRRAGRRAVVLDLLEEGATHVGVATDHVIESFRNDLWAELQGRLGHRPGLLGAVPAARGGARGARRGGVGRGRARGRRRPGRGGRQSAAADERVEQVVICTPDKDLAQCVSATRWSSSTGARARCSTRPAVREKFGVPPASIPDWLALVGDSADGFPGLPGWGKKSAAAVLAHYGTSRRSPSAAGRGRARRRGARRDPRRRARAAALFKVLATLRTDGDVGDRRRLALDRSPPRAGGHGRAAGAPGLARRADELAARRA